MFKKWIREVN
uniref:Uncharacterized protein n=1 Tax=Anguilla anguilla TaxID=7936 RepID=A0A0E9RFW4_ANGAN